MTNENNHEIKALAPAATGGTITTSGNYRIHTFTSNGTFTANKAMNVEVLIVGGGGSGAGDIGGGGGGGQVNYMTALGITAQNYSVVVGAGGVGYSGGNGYSSSFGGYSAGGGTQGSISGGNGGNSSKTINGVTTNYTGGAGSNSTGFTRLAGGGAGAGANGSAYSGTNGGNGGAGFLSTISGSSVYYGGGGGGGVEQCYWIPGTGINGGGNGGKCCSTYGTGGTPNTGGGAGGSGGLANSCGGSFTYAAGSGIVIIRYLSSQDITATNITITPNETPCRVGICTATVSVTWTNNASSTSVSDLSITVSNGTSTISPSSYPSVSFAANEIKGPYTFTVSNMIVGAHSICPNPN